MYKNGKLMTPEEHDKWVDDVVELLMSKVQEEQTVKMYQNCKTNGLVLRTDNSLKPCKDPKCTSCRDFEKMLNETINEKINLTDNQQVK